MMIQTYLGVQQKKHCRVQDENKPNAERKGDSATEKQISKKERWKVREENEPGVEKDDAKTEKENRKRR